ncbi:MAG TPA: histidine kinase [Candidatus Sulfopaludibacter sp.]|jgi:sensor histidine kinase YesM|nr:histidine kinase [Candidatus Sulfopaludibacter sp.]
MNKRLAYWPCQILGWGLYSAIGIFSSAQQVGWRFSTIAGYVLFFLYSMALTDLLRREMRRRDWLAVWGKRTVFRLLAALALLSAIQTFLVSVIDVTFLGKLSEFYIHREYLLALWVGIFGADAMWLLFYIALTNKRRYQEKEVRLQLAVREAELRALEAQVNPHFLFNCLNSIRAMVLENPALAQDMITRFASILRYNLQRDLNHTVALESEVEVVSHYLALEAIRFEDRLRLDLSIDPAAAKIAVPPMLLQTLVENSLKHGIAHLPAGGDLRIRARVDADTLVLQVENTGQLSKARPGGTQLGLANARERLRILYGGRAGLELTNGDGRVTATVRIPKSL